MKYNDIEMITKLTREPQPELDHQVKTSQEFENVCLEGGGIRGIAFIGVLKALEELHKVKGIKRYIGSSAGAIFAGAMACGYDSEQMKQLVLTTDFTQFMDGNWGQIGSVMRLVYYWGIYNGDYFYNWYGKVLEKTCGNPDITFLEAYIQFDKELYITGSNISTRQIHYFCRDSYPNMKIRDAVRISMSIPIFYVPVFHEKCYWVDGGYLDNYPLAYFDPMPFFGETLGFRLYPDKTIPEPINNITDFVTNLLETAVEQIDKLRLKPGDEMRSVPIHTFDIKSTDFYITKQQMEMLIESGYKSTIEFFITPL